MSTPQPDRLDTLFQKSVREREEELKRYWRIPELRFIGRFSQGFFQEVVVHTDPPNNDRPLLYPYGLGRVSGIHAGGLRLAHNRYYSFYAKLTDDYFQRKHTNPYLLKLDQSLPPAMLPEYTDARSFIKQLFVEHGESPKDAATIASQLTLNGLELYTETERFIYELIQNADDFPLSKEGVSIDIHLLEDFVLFMHDGQYFLRDQIEALCDAGKSTKKSDDTTTGYKGIGFKSVFSDSKKVFVHSGGYSFRFDKTYELYRDFWSLYEEYFIHRPNKKQSFEGGAHQEYEKTEKIPWQIKPIWTDRDEYSSQIPKFFFKKNVGFALEIGQSTLSDKNYEGVILKLLKEPRFLLFLRSVKQINAKLSLNRTIRLKKTFGEILSIQLWEEAEETGDSPSQSFNFVVSGSRGYEIPITADALEESGVKLNISETTDQNGSVKKKFINPQGEEISNIPEKLALSPKTTISFAIEFDRGGNRLKKIEQKDSILFNYLPTSDSKYNFPFLVNADFITESNRQYALVENRWNHFLFYYIGYLHVTWAIEVSKRHGLVSYLEIVVPHKVVQNEQIPKDIAEAFDRGFAKAISELAFVLGEDEELWRCDEVVLDKSGISDALGKLLFYQLYQLEQESNDRKVLVNQNIDRQSREKLAHADFGIDQFDSKRLKEILKTDAGRVEIQKWVKSLSTEEYADFLPKWDKLIKTAKLLDDGFLSAFDKIPWIRVRGVHDPMSWIEFQQESTLFPRYFKTEPIETILAKLGIFLTEVDWGAGELTSLKGEYFDKKIHPKERDLFDVISRQLEVQEYNFLLKIDEKRFLFDRLDNPNTKFNDRGDAYLKKLCLFCSANPKTPTPLAELIAPQDPLNPTNGVSWLAPYHIHPEEFFPGLNNHLIPVDSIYSSIIYPKWDAITSSVSVNSDQQAQSFLKEVIGYYQRAKDEGRKNTLTNAPFVWKNGEWFKPDEVLINPILKNQDSDGPLWFAFEKLSSKPLADKYLYEVIEEDNSPFHISREEVLLDKPSETRPASLTEGEVVALSQYAVKKGIALWNSLQISLSEGTYRVEANQGIKYYHSSPELEILLAEFQAWQAFPLSELFKKLQESECEKLGIYHNNSPSLFEEVEKQERYSQPWAILVSQQGTEIKKRFLKSDFSIYLSSKQEYDNQSPESAIFQMLIELLPTNPSIVTESNIRERIFLDSKQVDFAQDDQVLVGDSDPYEFSLSELTEEVDNLAGKLASQFSGLDREKLNNKVFKLQKKEPKEIVKDIGVNFQKGVQVAFALLVDSSSTEQALSDRSVNSVSDIEILDVFFQKKWRYLKEHLHLFPLLANLEKVVLPSDLAHEEEKLATEVEAWLQEPVDTDKLDFLLQQLGLRDRSSPVVQLRDLLFSDVQDANLLGGYKWDNLTVEDTRRTLELLTIRSVRLSRNIYDHLLKQLIQKAHSSKWDECVIATKTWDEVGQEYVAFAEHQESSSCLHIKTEKDFDQREVARILQQHKKHWFLAELYPKSEKLPQVQSLTVESRVDKDKLQENSSPWNEDFYQEWNQSNQIEIRFFPGEMPYNWILLEEVLQSYSEGDYFKQSDKLYYLNKEKDWGELLIKAGLPTEKWRELILKDRSREASDHSGTAFQMTPEEQRVWKDIKAKVENPNEIERLIELGLIAEASNKKRSMGHQPEPTPHNVAAEYNSGVSPELWVKSQLEERFGIERVKYTGKDYERYDFIVYTNAEKREVQYYIEVKSTTTGESDSDKIPINIRNSEWDFLQGDEAKGKYLIFRLFGVSEYTGGKPQTNRILKIDYLDWEEVQ